MSNERDLIEKIAEINEKFNSVLLGKNILIRFEVGTELATIFQRVIEKKIPPASTIKLFLLEQLLEQSLKYDEYIEYDSRFIQKGSGNNLVLNDLYTIGDLIKNMMVASSNVSTKMLEHYLQQFIQEDVVAHINRRNLQRNMNDSFIVDITGLPSKNQSIHLKDFSKFLDEHLYDTMFLEKLGISEFVLQPKNSEPKLIKNTFKINDLSVIGVKTGTLVPNLYNVVLFFELYGKRGYMLSFLNIKAKDRANDVTQLLKIMRTWREN